MSTHYELLQVAPTATAEDIKQAFRHLIARYHPDKVQHLGAEFQKLAEERSAALTTAYKTLIDPEARESYDAELRLSVRTSGGPGVRESDSGWGGRESGDVRGSESSAFAAERLRRTGRESDVGTATEHCDCHEGGRWQAGGGRAPFEHVRQESDALLKRAVLLHVDQVVGKALPQSERATTSGFDLAYATKPRLFGSTSPLVLVRFVPRLDAAALQELWVLAARASALRKAAACVLALAANIAPQHELAAVIAANQRRSVDHASITIVPVDVRDWNAWIPQDAHPTVKALARELAGR